MKKLLMISSGNRLYREYALRSIASHYEIVMLHDQPETWQKPYVVDFRQVPLTDYAVVMSAAQDVAHKHHLDGVFTYDEPSIEVTAMIAKELALPANSPASARLCRDKFAMRQAWTRAGVPSAYSYLVSSPGQAADIAAEIGYPVVLKPRSMAASIGVVRADTQEELLARYSVAAQELHYVFHGAEIGTLVEEYLDGPEISAESVVMEGEVHIVALTRKQVGLAPYFEELGHIVAPGEPLPQEQAIRAVVIAAHKALGLDYGVTHAELRLTEQGPRMIELNGRAAGDLIPYLVRLATGIDLSLAGAQVAVGEHPHLQASLCNAAAIQFIYPSYDGRLRDFQVDTEVSQYSWLDTIVGQLLPGDELCLPPRGHIPRLGFVVVTGSSTIECQERVKQSLSYIHIDWTPLVPQGIAQ